MIAASLQSFVISALADEFNAKILTFSKSAEYANAVNQAIASLPQEVFPRCPSLRSIDSSFYIETPPVFDEKGLPKSGRWKQSFPVSGCGNDTTINIYFQVAENGKFLFTLGAPGSTHGNLLLTHDAFIYANIGATLIVKDCKMLVVRNTRFETYGILNPPVPDPGPNDRLRPWWETWTMIGCGQTVDVPIDFIPDGTGVRIIQPGGSKLR